MMFAHAGDNKWAERLEVLGLNALPATVSEDMRTHQYVQQVNKTDCRKTPKSRNPISDVLEIELCPYGCARLRMTEMPVLKNKYFGC